MTRWLAFFVLLIAALLASAPLRADCVNPAGVNGEAIYNADHSVMQFCNGTSWISMAASGMGTEVDPKVGTLTNGKWCSSNGSIITCTEDAPVSGAGGSSGQIQYNNGTGLGGAAAVTYATSGDLLMVTAQAATDIPLVVKGAASQSAHLVEWRASDDSVLGYLTANGGLSLTGALGVTGATVLSSTLGVTGAVTAASFSGSGAGLTSIPVSAISATGTASSSTYLRGDGAWATVSAGGNVYNAGSSTTIDWSNGSVIYTSASCGSFTFSNMQDGGTYTLVVQGSSSGTCSFSHSGLTVKMPSGYTSSPPDSATAFDFTRAGSALYVKIAEVFCDGPCSCSAPWGATVASGDSVTAYLAATPAGQCSSYSETRTCNNGTLSGTYTYQSCSDGCAGTPWGYVSSGYSNTAYSSTTPASTCAAASETRTCTNGTLSGSYTAITCSNGCTGTPWGNVASGYSNTAYSTSTPAAACSTVAETRTCTNGSLSGSYTVTSCASGCTGTPWGNVASGYSNTAYSSSTPASTCATASETRTCTNGTLSGSYTTITCSNGCAKPWGGYIASGQSVTAYAASSVQCGSCSSQSRACTNGSLSGSYQYASCSASSCTWVNTGGGYGCWPRTCSPQDPTGYACYSYGSTCCGAAGIMDTYTFQCQ